MTPELQIAVVPLVKAPPTVSYIHSCDLLSYLEWSSFVGLTQSLTGVQSSVAPPPVNYLGSF